LVAKDQTRLDGLDDKIIALYARGMSVRGIRGHLGITGEGAREGAGHVDRRERRSEVLALGDERAQEPGVQDILIAVVDGLKGFPEAIKAAFPETLVQTCIVQLVRHSLNFCSWKDRKAVAARLREVDGAETAEAAWDALEEFDAEWGRQYPSIAQAWRRAWEQVIPFFAFSPEIRRVIYTTNAVESLNRVIRKAIKNRAPSRPSRGAEKLIYLAIRGHEKTSRKSCSRTASPQCRAESGHSGTGPGGRIHKVPDTPLAQS
jgi:transposase-like protein